MNIGEALARATEKLRAAGIDSARLNARVLMAHVLGVEPNELATMDFPLPNAGGGADPGLVPGDAGEGDLHEPLPRSNAARSHAPSRKGRGKVLAEFELLIHRRIAREPVAYITGKKGFWDLEFEVGPGALVPRPETETLIEQILKTFPDRAAHLSILDLGTGTGCILLTLLHLYPNAKGLGVDASESALGWARRNAAHLESRAELRLANWEDITETGFDIVVSNPPYLADADFAALEPELGFEPKDALSGGPDGLGAYRAIARLLPHLLAAKGCAVFEIGAGQGPSIEAILKAEGLEILSLAPDLSGIPRCVTARMGPAAPQKTVGNRRPSR